MVIPFQRSPKNKFKKSLHVMAKQLLVQFKLATIA
ncbi:hypothetical protein EVA_14680 [gut metagenome]|uniref:Uncharacterized protein n=1 Tax=gut metagenome TaxID=749906 RepID=J9CBB3_9ZZZZ